MTDPWLVRGNINNQESPEEPHPDANSNASNDISLPQSTHLQFEDNFLSTHNITNATDLPNSEHTPLPDSKDYLQSLEKKLKKIKQNPKILEALSQKRAECMRNLLDDNQFVNKDEALDLDTPLSSGESAVQEIYRHIQPVQALSVGETVHIVKYDQLEVDSEEIDGQQAQEDSTSESTSR